jgi:hypothetical protein
MPSHRSPSNVRLSQTKSDTSKNNLNFAAATTLQCKSCSEPFLRVKQDDLNRSPPFVLKTDTFDATKRKTKTDVHKSG